MAQNKINPAAPRTSPPAAQQPAQAAQQGQRQQAPKGAQPAGAKGRELTRRDINRLPGLGSGLNTDQTIEALIAVERKRLEPVQQEKVQRQLELESFNMVKGQLEKVQETSRSLASRATWEGKIVESSNEDVVKATATAGAKPGKYTMIVDKLALNHQIASQGYDSQDAQVGTGRFHITVGEGTAINVTVDAANNTLTGLKDAINTATQEVQASIIKTGNREKPYQLVLTSQKTGAIGRVKPEVELKGGTAPLFVNSVEEPSKWKGVGEESKVGGAQGGAGSSSVIARIVGDYKGDKDRTFTLSVVQDGVIGGDKQVQIRWKDNTGRSGLIQLDKLNYSPGTPVELDDGLAVIFSQGQVIVGDSFTFNARTARSDLSWWLADEDRKPSYTQPSSWSRQQTYGGPVIEGPYTGKDEQTFTLTVQGSGQIGSASKLDVQWKSSSGETGLLNIGDGYTAGGKLGLSDGVTVTLNQGVLSEGQQATFKVTPEKHSGKWWLSDKERKIPAQVLDVSNWSVKEEKGAVGGQMPELPLEAGPRTSNTKVAVAGTYTGDESKVYTFSAKADGAISTTRGLQLHWEDDKGNSGEVAAGDGYTAGTPLPFDAGLTVAFGAGRVFKGDSFTVRTRTATIQPPQDAQLRFGATELGGGLEITSPTNDMENVIEGVKLTLSSTNPKPVTVTIRGDTDKANGAIASFVNQVNDLEALIGELTKFDKENNYVGPLQANREVTDLRNRLTELVVDPIPGLPKTSNMVFGLGIKLNDKGMFVVDEDMLRQKVEKDFAAVADLFRDKGDSNNSNVAFVGMSDKTRISADGYPVKIAQAASQASYESAELHEPIIIDNTNNRIVVDVDGKRSDEIVIEPKVYSLAEYARTLQNKITNDKQVGERGVRVTQVGNRIHVQSGRFGKGSNVAFLASGNRVKAGEGLLDGTTNPGKDVEGTIAGQEAEGNGQLLKAKDGSQNVGGLRLLVKLNEHQLNAKGPDAMIKITRGVASRVSQFVNGEMDPFKGEIKHATDNLRSQITNIDTQLGRLEDRIEAKRKGLQEKFTRLESQMAKLKSQQNYMSGQLAQLGSGGGGGNLVTKMLG